MSLIILSKLSVSELKWIARQDTFKIVKSSTMKKEELITNLSLLAEEHEDEFNDLVNKVVEMKKEGAFKRKSKPKKKEEDKKEPMAPVQPVPAPVPVTPVPEPKEEEKEGIKERRNDEPIMMENENNNDMEQPKKRKSHVNLDDVSDRKLINALLMREYTIIDNNTGKKITEYIKSKKQIAREEKEKLEQQEQNHEDLDDLSKSLDQLSIVDNRLTPSKRTLLEMDPNPNRDVQQPPSKKMKLANEEDNQVKEVLEFSVELEQ